MIDLSTQILFSTLTPEAYNIRFQLAMIAWKRRILSDEYVNAVGITQKDFINNWLNDFEKTFTTYQDKINIMSARNGYFVASKALSINTDIEDFISLYRDEIVLYNSTDWAKARMLRNDVATRMKDYKSFYSGWETYLKSAQASGLSQTDRVTAYLNAGGKYFTGLRDSANRIWRPERYASMYANTRGSEAYNYFTEQRFISNGGDVVLISNHGTTTPICKEFEGKYFSLRGLTRGLPILPYQPPFHPNCKHIMLPQSGKENDVMRETNKMKNVSILSAKQQYTESDLKAVQKQKAYLSKNRVSAA